MERGAGGKLCKKRVSCGDNPLDCLTYYPDLHGSVFCVVECAGDLDEDSIDSKVSCTRMKILHRISAADLVAEGLLYVAKHPKMKRNGLIKRDKACAGSKGVARARAAEKQAKGGTSAEVQKFAVHFENFQREWKEMQSLVRKIADAGNGETAGKLGAAMVKVLEEIEGARI